MHCWFLIVSTFTMASGLTTVQEFLSRECVKRSMHRSTKTPQCVLSFFYGVDFESVNDVSEKLEQGKALREMSPLWFGSGGGEYDKSCTNFQGLVRLAGNKQLTAPEWQTSVDGLCAQLILCDQLSRNAFRGTKEAFAYDDTALEYANILTNHIFKNDKDDNKTRMSLRGNVYPPYVSNIIMALMHSEDIENHSSALKLLSVAPNMSSSSSSSPPSDSSLQQWWSNQKESEMEHKRVIDRFGRYPHRNKLKGRISTSEEEKWLADKENLPRWAKSQQESN
mmetsp:Transcript_5541/g.7285  ORF Transcript_5541/g.7285 Transcript_5541/m.7285 type:complete len:280 (+) Transcript_5541:13-852(+)